MQEERYKGRVGVKYVQRSRCVAGNDQPFVYTARSGGKHAQTGKQRGLQVMIDSQQIRRDESIINTKQQHGTFQGSSCLPCFLCLSHSRTACSTSHLVTDHLALGFCDHGDPS